ncbi:hypothetical protein E3Q16_03783 [Wallemia mellicola]|uniref:Uncharacterized protein n=1 Tax=Wallemia mellicola TaxID=1708541 RepID=A0A4T0MP79_9BASI|nr:hypothetical protein E3Q21_01955 [Wallemia mellicola]TIB88557.1 hypothetical protein E3Q20_01948 [Wallemia mellicola]TIC01331.1 hypothetical protein E3Q16_03783 [Wallemia mellicola]TIC40822.1 hypothetical protein E3Q07_01943 [Wallemia mellicola]TIC49312.1 hypothetical protein E3Q06_01864 [Wallemia mellicola]
MQYIPEMPLSDALPLFTNVVDPEELNRNFFALPTLEEHYNETNALASWDATAIVQPSIAPALISKKRNAETAGFSQPKAVKKTATIVTQKRQANAKGTMYNDMTICKLKFNSDTKKNLKIRDYKKRDKEWRKIVAEKDRVIEEALNLMRMNLSLMRETFY